MRKVRSAQRAGRMDPPYFENFGKRLVKTPKIYFTDSGLACHLLGVDSIAELEESPFHGALLEGFMAAETVKAQVNAGRRRELYYFRDEQGLEVDFVVPGKGGMVTVVECKTSRTPTPAMAAPMLRLAQAMKKKRRTGTTVDMVLVHRPPEAKGLTQAVAPGVRALA